MWDEDHRVEWPEHLEFTPTEALNAGAPAPFDFKDVEQAEGTGEFPPRSIARARGQRLLFTLLVVNPSLTIVKYTGWAIANFINRYCIGWPPADHLMRSRRPFGKR